MKKLLIFLVLVGFTQLSYSQSLIQTFTDRCTGETKVFSIAMQGTTTVVFYNKSRTFTAADVQSGVFQAWLEETYAWWLALSPCSTNQSSTTNTQTTTQQTTSNATAAASNATSSSASTANTGSTASTASTDTGSTASTDTGSTANTADTAGGTASSETTNTGTNDTSNTNSSSETGSPDQGSTGDSGSTDSSSSDTGSTDNSSDTSSGDTSSEGSTGDGDGSTSDSSGGSEGDSTEEGGTTGDGETSEGDSGETTEEGTGESESKSEDSKEGESSEEDSKSESKEEESKEEEVEESKEEESKEESEEEKQEEESEESDEESEEDTEEESDEEESDEEESDDEESEEEEEEDSEEESNNEDEEEDNKKKKKKRNLAPPIISANLMTMQMLDGTLSTAASFGVSQSSLTGVETYSLNTMIWSNLKQFMIGGGVSTVYFRYDRKEPRMLIDPDTGEYHQFGYSMEKGSIWSIDSHNVNFMYMFGTKMVSYTYSQVYLGQKDNVWKGFVGGYAATSSLIFLPESTMYSPSLTFFGTKPVAFKALKRWSFGPMVAVSLSPLQILNTKNEYNKDKVEFVWNKYFTYIIGTNANFNLTQRFAANLGINTINNTSIDIPTTFAVTIGARFAF